MTTTTPTTTTVPLALLGLGLIMNGDGVYPSVVVSALEKALREADHVFAAAVDQEMPQSFAASLVAETHRARLSTKPDEALTFAVDDALMLGAALAYRYFVQGGR